MIQELSHILPQDRILTKKEDLIPYSFDGTAQIKQLPAAVVFPINVQEVSSLLQCANRHKTPIVTRGSGTGLSGGSIPVVNGVVICTVRMNRLLEIDSSNLCVRVEPGLITADINKACEPLGLFYPPDPSSMKISTIGGNLAENSGGLRGLKYGVTKDYVLGLEVVLADGTIIQSGNKCVKDVAGFFLKDWFIGSEGTLGIITQALLKLVPIPRSKKTLVAYFDRMTDAAETVSAVIAAKIIPCTMEFLDQITMQCVEDYAQIGLPRDAEAMLLMETDGHPHATEEEILEMQKIALAHGAKQARIATDDSESAQLSAARRTAFSALARIQPTTILEDVTVPRSELAKMVQFIHEIARRFDVRIGTFGHMGDGNLHPTFLTNEKNTEELHRVEEAMELVFAKAVELGGTITGEHGVGVAKKASLAKLLPRENIRLMQTIKRAMDPNNILNPGKVFDL